MEDFNAIDYLMTFGKSGKPVKDLSRIEKLLSDLGSPQRNLRFIHIAGTNGKGSVLEMTATALTKAGYRTGRLTSPFIRRYTDRIRIDGREIDETALEKYCRRIAGLEVTKDCSQFEITLAAALLWFRDSACDVVLLETGIGGLLDATNVIEKPLLSVITTISLDHTAILGDSIEKIAAQKAGIIKPGCPVAVMEGLDSKALEVIKKTAAKKGSELIIAENMNKNGSFYFEGRRIDLAMAGEHQKRNAALAVTALMYLRKYFSLPDSAIISALEETRVEGRVQKLSEKPLIYLDGGHNEEGIGALCDFLKTQPRPLTGVVGMGRAKDWHTGCGLLSKVLDRVLCVEDFMAGAVPAEELARLFPAAETSDTEAALKEVFSLKEGTGVICGSLYLVSRVLESLKGEKETRL